MYYWIIQCRWTFQCENMHNLTNGGECTNVNWIIRVISLIIEDGMKITKTAEEKLKQQKKKVLVSFIVINNQGVNWYE